QQRSDALVRGLRNVKGEIGRAWRKPKQIADALIVVDDVHVECRQRDAVGIEQPGAFAGTLPGVLAEVIRHFARIRPDLWAFLVEADAHRRSADEGQERAARLAMQVD